MATYRMNNISFTFIDAGSATVKFDVERLDEEWVRITTATTSVDTRKSALEIAKDIGVMAKQIASKDTLINDVFVEVVAILTSKEFVT